jgi:hypothetical protein
MWQIDVVQAMTLSRRNRRHRHAEGELVGEGRQIDCAPSRQDAPLADARIDLQQPELAATHVALEVHVRQPGQTNAPANIQGHVDQCRFPDAGDVAAAARVRWIKSELLPAEPSYRPQRLVELRVNIKMLLVGTGNELPDQKFPGQRCQLASNREQCACVLRTDGLGATGCGSNAAVQPCQRMRRLDDDRIVNPSANAGDVLQIGRAESRGGRRLQALRQFGELTLVRELVQQLRSADNRNGEVPKT